MSNDRQLKLEKIMGQINKDSKYQDDSGDPILVNLSAKPANVPTISSGSFVLDYTLGGGFGKGRVVEIFGAESSGKTSIALTTIANVQRDGGTAVFIDAEHALDPRYAKKLGVNTDNLIISQPSTAEQILDLIFDLTNSNLVDIIVVDSVAAMVPKAELEGDAGDHTIGLVARLLSRTLRKIVASASKSGTTVIFLNQVRDNIGGFSPFGTPKTTPGGKALKFYASQRVETKSGKPIREKVNGKEEQLGTELKVKAVKNKIAPPHRSGDTVLTYNKGVNQQAEIVEVGLQYGVIYKESPTARKMFEKETGEDLGNSKAEVIKKLEEDSELFNRLRKALEIAFQENDDYDIVSNSEPNDEVEEE